MLSVSQTCLSNSEPEILVVLLWARALTCCCLQSPRHRWKVLLTQWRDALGLWDLLLHIDTGWDVAQLSVGFACYNRVEEVWDLLFLDTDGSNCRPFCLCTSRSLWPEDSLSLHDSPLAARTYFCLLIPESSVCPALFPSPVFIPPLSLCLPCRPGRHCLYTPASPGCSPPFLAAVPFPPSSWSSSPLQSFSQVSLSWCPKDRVEGQR